MEHSSFSNLLRKNSRNRSLDQSSSFLSGARWFNPIQKKRLYSDSPSSAGSKLSVFQNPDIKFLEGIKISENGHRKTSLFEGGTAKYRSDMSYMTHTAGTGTKGLGLMHGKMNLIKSENHRIPDLFGNSNQRLLDETSLGDFLRALTSLHNRVGTRQNLEEQRLYVSSNPTPTLQSHSLIDLSPTREIPSNLTMLGAPLNRTESMPLATEKEPSNLRRLGRFLLRSYSSRSESHPDVSVPENDEPKSVQTDIEKNSIPGKEEPVISSIRIQMPNTSQDEFCKRSVIMRSNTMDSVMRPKVKVSRGGFGDPFRPTASTESVYPSIENKGFPPPPSSRQTSLRWRTSGRGQGEICSSKPSLSNVKEVIN